MRVFIIWSVVFALGSCYRTQREADIFFVRQMKKTFVCDTIFDKSLRDRRRIIKVYEESDGSTLMKNEHLYFRFRVSNTENSAWMLIRSKGSIVYIIPEDALLHPNLYHEEMLIDFNARENSTWSLSQGGILGNSIFTLDSVNRNGSYYLSARNNYNIADNDQILKLTISKHDGIKGLSIISLGDTVTCQCLD